MKASERQTKETERETEHNNQVETPLFCIGICKYGDGTTYIGEWIEDVRQGRGVTIYSSDGRQVHATWADDCVLTSACAKIVFANGDMYDGLVSGRERG